MLYRLNVGHTTRYRYRRAVQLQPHRMLLTPRSSPQLRVISARIDCQPAATLTWSEDAYGNLVATASFASTTSELLISNQLVVELPTSLLQRPALTEQASHYPFRYSDEELQRLRALMQPSYADPGGRLSLWARQHIYGSHTDTLSLLDDLNQSLLQRLRYRARLEEGTKTPLQTLDSGEGACRDLATLFIEAARHLGFAARAVSGYLFDATMSSQPGSGSTHAWAQVYLPGVGWLAFDPTHQRRDAGSLIAVAVAPDITQIAPITGGYFGTASDFLSMDVAVSVTRSAGD